MIYKKDSIRLKTLPAFPIFFFFFFFLSLCRRTLCQFYQRFWINPGKHSFFFNKDATLLKKRIWYRCFPVNFAKFLRTPFLQNIFGRLLLKDKLASKTVKYYAQQLEVLLCIHEYPGLKFDRLTLNRQFQSKNHKCSPKHRNKSAKLIQEGINY